MTGRFFKDVVFWRLLGQKHRYLLRRNPIDGKRQVGYYRPGVGTMDAPTAHNKISKGWSVVMGLAEQDCWPMSGTRTAT
jgi:hypothetical protein